MPRWCVQDHAIYFNLNARSKHAKSAVIQRAHNHQTNRLHARLLWNAQRVNVHWPAVHQLTVKLLPGPRRLKRVLNG